MNVRINDGSHCRALGRVWVSARCIEGREQGPQLLRDYETGCISKKTSPGKSSHKGNTSKFDKLNTALTLLTENGAAARNSHRLSIFQHATILGAQYLWINYFISYKTRLS